MNTSINKAIESVLKEFGDTYFIDGVVHKSRVIQDLDEYKEELIEKFISNETLKKYFTIDISGHTIIQVNKLIEVFEADEYWESSFTKYTRKIGLTAGGKFIDESQDVVLDFPYKDTVLKASMSKEDSDKDDLRPDEPFLNEVIAREEIDVLLDKKILVNAKKYDEKGVHEVDSFDENDNLIIKGNNLLALHTLKEKYAGKVKLIYIDPPYNTGNDSFQYNDRFNRSTWLTFMLNRLVVARKLLHEKGNIAIHVDNCEMHYLKVLCDEVFGEENFQTTLTMKVKAPSGVASGAQAFFDCAEYVLVYSKNRNMAQHNEIMMDAEIINERSKTASNYNMLLHRIDPEAKKLIYTIDDVRIYEYDSAGYEIERMTNRSEQAYYENFDKVFRTAAMSGGTERKVKRFLDTIDDANDKLFSYEYTPSRGRNEGRRIEEYVYKKGNMLMLKDYARKDDRQRVAIKTEHITNIIVNDWWQGIANEGGVTLKNGKKPEHFLYKLIELFTDEGDFVLDFFMGTGTTQAVAHKTDRRYIGIEQIDYEKNAPEHRLGRVIDGDPSGISKDVNWQGGGSFVYVELMEKNRGFIESISKVKNQNELDEVFAFLLEQAEIDFRVDLEKVKDSLNELSLDDQKRTLFKIIDKNQLYYNYSEIDDENVRDLISDNDYQFNKSFYGKNGEGDE